MAVECCTGQDECTLVVTIGYLKNFVGSNIQTTGGTTVSVITPAGKNDDYAPTYTELTNGSILPKYVDGDTNRWASNVDGISIANASSYSGNQSVKQTDLTMTYTRFKSLTITVSKNTFSECGDNATLNYTFTLTKYTKYMKNNCTTDTTSSDGRDTAASISYITSPSWLYTSGSRIYGEKNSSSYGYADSRSGTVYGRVRYKGSYRNSSSITITQNALTGSYSEYVGKTQTGVDVTPTGGTTFDCAGGTFGVSSIGYYYETYRWVDSCGESYPDITTDYSYSEDAGSTGGSFSKYECPDVGNHNNTRTLTITYGGYSDSATFTQQCKICEKPDDSDCDSSCDECCGECTSGREWGTASWSGNVGACGGVVTISTNVPYTSHTRVWEDGVCKDTTGTSSEAVSFNVTVTDNPYDYVRTITGSQDRVNYTIAQTAGPDPSCCPPSVTYVYGSVTVPCDAASSVRVSVPYTATTSYGTCHFPSSKSYGSVTEYVYNLECNSGSQRNIPGYYFTVIQQGGCTCPCTGGSTTYTYGKGSISCESATTKNVDIPYTATTTYGNCPTETSYGSTRIVYNNIPCNSGTSVDRSVTYGGRTYTVTQAGGCDCECRSGTTYAFEPQGIPCESASSIPLTVRYSATTWYEGACAKASETTTANTSITLTNVACNSGAAKTWTAETTVGSGVTITQSGDCVCECTGASLSYKFEPLSIPCDKIVSTSYTVAYSAITTYGNCPSAYTTADTTITLSNIECNSGAAKTWTATTTVGSGVTVTQAGGCTCTCTGANTTYVFEPINIPCNSAESISREVGWTATTTYGNCGPTTETGKTGITLTNVECNSGAAKTWTATTTVGSGVTVTQAGECTCECTGASTTFAFDELNIPCDAIESSSFTVSYTAVTTYGNCPSASTTGDVEVTLENIECNSGAAKSWVVNVHIGSGVTVNQAGGCYCGPPCECSGLTLSAAVVPTSQTGYYSYNVLVAKYDINDICIDEDTITITSYPNFLSDVRLDKTDNAIRASVDSAYVKREGDLVISYTAGPNTCSATTTIVVQPLNVDCEDSKTILTSSLPTTPIACNPGDVLTYSFESADELNNPTDPSENYGATAVIDNQRKKVTFTISNNAYYSASARLYIGDVEDNCYVDIDFTVGRPDCSCDFTITPINCVDYNYGQKPVARINGIYGYCKVEEQNINIGGFPEWVYTQESGSYYRPQLTNDRTELSVYLARNDTGEARSGTGTVTISIGPQYGGQYTACTKTFTIYQCPEPCTCQSMKFSANTTPSSGNATTSAIEFAPSGYTTHKLIFKKDCGNATLTVESGSEYFDVVYNQSESYSNRIVYDITPKQINLDHANDLNGGLKVVAKDSSGNVCSNLTIPLKQKKMPCDCDSVDKYFLFDNKYNFPYTGISTPVMVASADTKGCGQLRVSSQSTIFSNGSLVTVDKGNYTYEYWCSGITQTTSGRSTGVHVVLEHDGRDYDCGEVRYVQQTSDACWCNITDNLQFISYTGSNAIDCDEESTLNIYAGNLPSCIRVHTESPDYWIYGDETYGVYSNEIKVRENDTGAIRTGTVNTYIYIDGNYFCKTGTTTIWQNACVPCTCDNFPTFYAGLNQWTHAYQKTSGVTMPISGDTMQLCIKTDGSFPNGCWPSASKFMVEKYDDAWPDYTTPTAIPQRMGEWLTFTQSGYTSGGCITITAPVNNIMCVGPGGEVDIWDRSAKLKVKIYDSGDTLCQDDVIYEVTQRRANCACSAATVSLPWGPQGNGVFTVDSSATGVTLTPRGWDGVCPYTLEYSGAQYASGCTDANNEHWINWQAASVSSDNSLTIPFTGPNTTGQQRICGNVGSIYAKLDGVWCPSGISQVTIIQNACGCNEYESDKFKFESSSYGFKDCTYNSTGYWYNDMAYFNEHTGDTSADIGTYGTIKYSGGADTCLIWTASAETNTQGADGLITPYVMLDSGNLNVYIQINTGATFPADESSIVYYIYVDPQEAGGNSCRPQGIYVGSFTLYKDGCDPTPPPTSCRYACATYDLSNSINIVSQQLQRGGGSVKVAEVTLPTGEYAHCLTVTATSTSNGITVTMSGGDIYATADNTAPDAPTIDVHVLNTGMGHSCGDSSSYYQWITLTVS